MTTLCGSVKWLHAAGPLWQPTLYRSTRPRRSAVTTAWVRPVILVSFACG